MRKPSNCTEWPTRRFLPVQPIHPYGSCTLGGVGRRRWGAGVIGVWRRLVVLVTRLADKDRNGQPLARGHSRGKRIEAGPGAPPSELAVAGKKQFVSSGLACRRYGHRRHVQNVFTGDQSVARRRGRWRDALQALGVESRLGRTPQWPRGSQPCTREQPQCQTRDRSASGRNPQGRPGDVPPTAAAPAQRDRFASPHSIRPLAEVLPGVLHVRIAGTRHGAHPRGSCTACDTQRTATSGHTACTHLSGKSLTPEWPVKANK